MSFLDYPDLVGQGEKAREGSLAQIEGSVTKGYNFLPLQVDWGCDICPGEGIQARPSPNCPSI